jgi:hypothetical protein
MKSVGHLQHQGTSSTVLPSEVSGRQENSRASWAIRFAVGVGR